jgi:hypothetical protein
MEVYLNLSGLMPYEVHSICDMSAFNVKGCAKDNDGGHVPFVNERAKRRKAGR